MLLSLELRYPQRGMLGPSPVCAINSDKRGKKNESRAEKGQREKGLMNAFLSRHRWCQCLRGDTVVERAFGLTSGGIDAVSPATFAHHTIRYEYAAIQTIEPMNVMGKNLFPRGVRVSGSVNHNGKMIGATSKYVMRSFIPDGHAILRASGSSSSGTCG